MAGSPSRQSSGSVRLGFLFGLALGLAGATAVIAAIIPIHPGGAPRQFSAFGCDYEIQFNGTTLDDKDTPDPSDDEYTWSYTVTELNGPGCDLSHWVLTLCQPEAFDAYLDSEPDPSFQVINDPGTTGLTGVKWNDILNGFVSGTFTVTLSQNFPLDQSVDVGFKTGAGVVPGTIEGPSCAVPTPTPTPPPVGGVVELRVGGADTPSRLEDGSDPSASGYAAVAGIAAAAAAAVALAAGGLVRPQALAAIGGWLARRAEGAFRLTLRHMSAHRHDRH